MRSEQSIAASVGALRSADNTVHDLIAVASDLRRFINDYLYSRGYDDLRPSFAPLLTKIWSESVPQVRLADELGISEQGVSQTVGLAERAGYVAREPNPADGRSKLVVLTPLGRRFVNDGGEAIATRAGQYEALLGSSRFHDFEASLALLDADDVLGHGRDQVTRVLPRSRIISVASLGERAVGDLRDALGRVGPTDLRGTQTRILVQVGPRGVRASELARSQRVSRQAISATLHELEALEYLNRHDDDDDGRGVVFVPTARGQAHLDAYVEGIDDIEDGYRMTLGDERFGCFVDTSRDLRHRIRLDSNRSARPAQIAGASESSGTMTDAHLGELATDLRSWLGDGDAARLGELLRPPTSPGI